ncbi:hypothetical protein A0G_0377 [Streptococcus iniae 9117]|nr:hypothetical protein A0G_0377 [Streptococcus iniae 9117]
MNLLQGFGSIQNNTALKRFLILLIRRTRFGTIQNNTALKHSSISDIK